MSLSRDNLLLLLLFFVMIYTFEIIPYHFFLGGLTLISIFYLLNNVGFQKPKSLKILLSIFTLFLAWTFINAYHSLEVASSISNFFEIFFPAFGIIIGILSIHNPQKFFERTLIILVATGTLHGLFVWSGLLFGERVFVDSLSYWRLEFGSIIIDQQFIGNRQYGLTSNPNFLGMWLFFSLMALIYLKQNKKVNYILFSVLLIINISTLLMTGSRTSIAVVLIFGGILLLLPLRHRLPENKRVFPFIVLLTSLFAVILLFCITLVSKRRFLSGRAEAWQEILDYSKSNPILGTGFGLSNQMLRENGVNVTAHNIYLRILAETGFPGLLLFLSFLVVWVIFLYRKFIYTKNEYIKQTLLFIIVFVGAMLSHQFFESSIFKNQPFHVVFIFFVFLGIRYLYYNQNVNKQEQ